MVELADAVTQESSAPTRLNREQNEILRKVERLKQLMNRLLERYERALEPGHALALFDARHGLQVAVGAGVEHALHDLALRFERDELVADFDQLLVQRRQTGRDHVLPIFERHGDQRVLAFEVGQGLLR